MDTATIPASTPAALSPSALHETGFITPEPWVDDALCGQTFPDAFFPDPDTPEQSKANALKVCGACTVREECLAYALANNERYGIWGGLTPRERRAIKPFPRTTQPSLCSRGHDLTPENTYRRPNGTLNCKECEQERKLSA